jgi:hypothetical protein
MKKVFTRGLLGIAALAVPAGGLMMAGVGPASASVTRNQITTSTYTVNVNDAGTHYIHSYTVTPNPCGADFTGTGQYPATGTPTFTESSSGSVAGNPAPGVGLTYTDTYYTPSTTNPTGYTYTFKGTFTDTQGDFTGTISDSLGQNLPATGTVTGTRSTDVNHGQYVSANGGGSDAAHSCVGMPVQSHK